MCTSEILDELKKGQKNYYEKGNELAVKTKCTFKITNKDIKKEFIERNTLNFQNEEGTIDYNTPIYRIFPLDRLLEALKDKQFCLVKPEAWDDPYENSVLDSKGITKNNIEVSLKPIKERYYGQCWSLKEECDGLWRNYTKKSCEKCNYDEFEKNHGKPPISAKVKTTVGKLMNAFYNENNLFHSSCYYIGKVKYVEVDDIKEVVKNAMKVATCQNNYLQVMTLLMKRKPFEYENEVRLLYSKTDDDNLGKLFKFDINPDELIDEIILDPWVKPEQSDSIIQEIQKYYKGKVGVSKLYEKGDLVFQIDEEF